MRHFYIQMAIIATIVVLPSCTTPDDKYVKSYILHNGGCSHVSLFMNKVRTDGVANITHCKSNGSEPIRVTRNRVNSVSSGEGSNSETSVNAIASVMYERQVERDDEYNNRPQKSKKLMFPFPALADALARERLNCDIIKIGKDKLIHLKCTPYDAEAVALLEKIEES